MAKKEYKKATPRKVNPQAMLVKKLCALWRTASVEAQGSWNQLAQMLNNALVAGLPGRQTALGTFIAHNSTLSICSLPLLTDAPEPPADGVPVLPDLVVNSSFDGSLLTLTVTASDNYSGMVIVYGGRPLLPGRSLYENTPWAVLETLNDLPINTPVDIGPAYSQHFRVRRIGYIIPIKIVPVTASGFRGVEALALGKVTTAAAAKGRDANVKASKTLLKSVG